MQILRADTITEVTVGPVVAVADGFTPVTTLTIASADEAEFIKHGATTNTAIAGTVAAITNADGYYALDLSATDTDTEGRLTLLINDDSLCLPVRHDFMIVNANVFDSLYASATTDYLQTDVTQVSGVTEDISTETKQDLIDTAVDAIKVKTDSLTFTTANQVDANALAISSDSAAADNLEATYDGTGYADGSAPATQTAVSNISASSAAISTTASSATVTTGTETLTYTATAQLDGTLHEVADVTLNTEFYYEFSVGGKGVPVEFLWDGYAQSNGDSYAVKAYNWAGTAWEQIGSIPGANGTTLVSNTFQATDVHVGTGADLGKVRLQFTSSDGTHFVTDRVLCSYAVVTNSVGYAGSMVWIDTVSGTAGTEEFVNGTADNPVLTLADALTLALGLGLKIFHASRDSVIAPSANFQDYTIYGTGYTFTLGGWDYSGTHVFHSSPVTGIALSGGSDHFDCLDSIVGNVTVNDAHFTNCGFNGTVTLGAVSGDLKVINSRSLIAGATTPILDFGTTAAISHNVTYADWQNGLEVRNFNNQGTDLFSLSGCGQLVVASTCSGTMNIRGTWRITDNSAGAVTFIYDDIRTGTPTADQLAYMVENAATGVPVTFTTAGGGTTIAVINLVDGASGSSTDDQYNGRLLVFTDGTLKGVVTDITDYVGSTTTATISTIPVAPESTHNARLI